MAVPSRFRIVLLALVVATLVGASCSSGGTTGTATTVANRGTGSGTVGTSGSSPAKGTAPTGTAPGSGTDEACGGLGSVNAAVPAGSGPGDLVASEELTEANRSSKGFPTSARAWRILYVSTGVDETDLSLVCGTAAAPEQGPNVANGKARMLAWSHGTVGLAQRCLPSADPAAGLWGVMPGGIGAIGFADPGGIYEGDPSGGALQYAMNQGWVVAATDYRPNNTYVIGKMAAGNVLDSTRAVAQLLIEEKVGTTPDTYQMVTWGHSQGGHASIWAGQLAETYFKATKPSKPTPAIELVGVIGLAPASTFVGTRGTATAGAAGLADWEMHQSVEVVGLPIPKLELQIGPALFSFIFGSWASFSQQRPPAADAVLPAFPAASGKLDPSAVLTSMGQATVDTIVPLCLHSDAKAVKAAVDPYRDAKTNQMLVPSAWNLPSEYKVGDFFLGGLDATCAGTPPQGLADWCSWIRWNLPGPVGTNPFPKVPSWGGKPVPMLIGQGLDDTIIHCVPGSGASSSTVPEAGDCMSRALFDDLRPVYCPDGQPAASSLTLTTVRKDGLGSPASHLSIPGQLSAKNWTLRGKDMVFTGSPVQTFMDGAFAASIPSGCGSSVENP